MNADEALAARTTLGLSQEELASDLGLTPHVVAAWEDGRVRIPKQVEDHLRFEVAAMERRAAIATSGLPECEWETAWANESVPDSLKAQTEYLERGFKHRTSCPTCMARDKYVEDRFGKMPPAPMSTSLRMFGSVMERIEKLPRWAQPAAWVGLAFGAYSVVRILFLLPSLVRNPQYWPVSLKGLALSISIGAAIGLIYGGLREVRAKTRDH